MRTGPADPKAAVTAAVDAGRAKYPQLGDDASAAVAAAPYLCPDQYPKIANL